VRELGALQVGERRLNNDHEDMFRALQVHRHVARVAHDRHQRSTRDVQFLFIRPCLGEAGVVARREDDLGNRFVLQNALHRLDSLPKRHHTRGAGMRLTSHVKIGAQEARVQGLGVSSPLHLDVQIRGLIENLLQSPKAQSRPQIDQVLADQRAFGL